MSTGSIEADIIIVGAGAAGLAAAAELVSHGRSVLILEARDRIGGRILTRREPDAPTPIELGAEFIHGNSPRLMEWMRKAHEPVIDASQTRWMLKNKKLQPADDVFEEMKRGLRTVSRPKKDLPFAEFLENAASRRLSASSRAFARMLVEGFDAADSRRVSTLEILDEWSGAGAADAPTFRPLNGYSSLVGAIAANLPPTHSQLRLNASVTEIQWTRKRVRIKGVSLGQPFETQASQAIVTLPLGVLQRASEMPGGVLFTPPLTAKQHAFTQVASGPVVKLVLRFDSAFWELLDDGRYRDAAFFQAPDAIFPTFWTSLPVRSSMMIAWTAGPNASRLSSMQEEQIVRAALDTLDSMFGSRAGVRQHLVCAYSHDWQADQYSCGAYSYVLAGGGEAREALAQPLANTLFFAGEAMEYEGEAATVAGALQSGQRAARQALRALSGAQRSRSRDRRQPAAAR